MNFGSSSRMVNCMADLSTLGRRIRHFRTKAGLTLEELGEITGTAPSQLSMVENGHREPRLSLLEAIAAALSFEIINGDREIVCAKEPIEGFFLQSEIIT